MKVQIKSEKGNIAAVTEEPTGEVKGLAVLMPGFLDSKDYYGLVELGKTLAANGFTAIRFDPTGTWESSGNISDYSMSQYLKDLSTVIEYAKNKNNKLKKIILLGHSLGGLISITYAAQNKGISAIIPIMPPYAVARRGNIEENWEKNGLRHSKRDLPTDKSKKIEFNVPYAYVIDSKKYDARELVGKITAPLYLIAGENDKLITPQMVEEIYQKANEPKKLIVLKNIGHDFRHKENETEIVCRQVEEIIKKLFWNGKGRYPKTKGTYTGTIIEESLEDKKVLDEINIVKTKIEKVTAKHKTPWVKEWNLHSVEIPDKDAEKIAQKLSKALDFKHAWYADFKNETRHYIIYKNKVFCVDKTSAEEYNTAKEYGLSLGIPEYQVDFHPQVKEWER